MGAPQQLLLSGGYPASPVTGMTGWYRADTLSVSGSAVTTWTDKSGNGNNFLTVTSGRRPALVTSDSNFAGMPTVQWNNAAQTVLESSALLSAFVSASAHTFFCAVRFTAFGSGTTPNTQWASIMADRGPNFIYGVSSSALGASINDGSYQSATVTASTNTTYGIESRHDTGSLFQRISGSPETSVTAGNISGLGNAVDMGNITTGPNLDGFVAEYIIYNTALSAVDRATNRAYFTGRYGIAWQPR